MSAEPMPPRTEPQKVIVEKAVKPGLARSYGVNLASLFTMHFVLGNITFGWLPFLFAAILGWVGWKVIPPKAETDKLDRWGQSAKEVAEKFDLKEKAGDYVDGAKSEVRKAVVTTATNRVMNRFGVKTPEQIERERQEQLSKDRAEAAFLNVLWQEDWDHQRLAAEIKKARDAIALAKKTEEESRERKALTEEATTLRYGVNPDWDMPTLRNQVKLARQAANANAGYQLALQLHQTQMDDYNRRLDEGPNANCPRCKFPLRLRTTNIDTRQAICPRCNFVATRRVWLNEHRDPPAPKEPKPPGMVPGLLGRFLN